MSQLPAARDPEPTVAVVALDGMNPFEFSVACEVFGIRRGEVLSRPDVSGWYDLKVCSPAPGRPLSTSLGFSFTADYGLDDVATADMVIVPMCPKPPGSEYQPAGSREPHVPGADVLEALAAADARGATMVSFCSGAFALAAAGVLDGLRATTHWMYLDTFRRWHPRVEIVPDVLYVDEGRILTSAGSASAIDLSLHIIRREHGADVADLVARRMVVPPHRDGGQAQYITVPESPPRGTPFAAVLDWIVEHLHESIEVADMARQAAMSERTFARKFREATGTTPHQWLTQQRVVRARGLLETTDLTVDAIASRSGFGSAANLRARFQAACGIPPTTYRQRFRRQIA